MYDLNNISTLNRYIDNYIYLFIYLSIQKIHNIQYVVSYRVDKSTVHRTGLKLIII